MPTLPSRLSGFNLFFILLSNIINFFLFFKILCYGLTNEINRFNFCNQKEVKNKNQAYKLMPLNIEEIIKLKKIIIIIFFKLEIIFIQSIKEERTL